VFRRWMHATEDFEQCEKRALHAVAARARLVERKIAKQRKRPQSIDEEAMSIVCSILSRVWWQYIMHSPQSLQDAVFPCEFSCRQLMQRWISEVAETRQQAVERVLSHKLENMDYSCFAKRSNKNPVLFRQRIVRSWLNPAE